ncbi:MAG: NfeD family protein [Clostridia bacterium]|nr:NfeD family protein [Clostridia bacterium]
MYWIIWLCFALVLLTVELLTVDLVAIWFAISSLILVIVTAIFPNLQLIWQIVIFLATSVVFMLSTHKLVKKFMKRRKEQETNLELILNHTGIVVESINNDLSMGTVKINGMTWNARSDDGSDIPSDSLVTVKKIDGNKLIVDLKNK